MKTGRKYGSDNNFSGFPLESNGFSVSNPTKRTEKAVKVRFWDIWNVRNTPPPREGGQGWGGVDGWVMAGWLVAGGWVAGGWVAVG